MSIRQAAGIELRVLIAAEHSSLAFGGEAALPLHYFRVLRARGVEAWLVTHARTRDELKTFFSQDGDRIVYVEDLLLHRLIWRAGRNLPGRLGSFTTDYLLRLLTQILQWGRIRRLVREKQISVVHQPIPVSPKEPSLLFCLGAPVIIGPMNGGMDFPPAFRRMQGRIEGSILAFGRQVAQVLNFLIPGKRSAALLLVANERTRNALPFGIGTPVRTLVENGVDLSLWRPPTAGASPLGTRHTRYVFVGRLIAWKAVDLLLEAFKIAATQAPMSLTIIGDGPELRPLAALASRLGLQAETAGQAGKVEFTGWLSQAVCATKLAQADALVLPSLRECGGAVVLEAMAMGIPAIATDWGGPADYLDASCGILVPPSGRGGFVAGFADAMARLARQPDERAAMGRAGREKMVREFDWEVKVDRMMQIYEEIAAAARTSGGKVR